MGKLKHNFKKGITLVLSLAMVAGLALAMSGGAKYRAGSSRHGNRAKCDSICHKGPVNGWHI